MLDTWSVNVPPLFRDLLDDLALVAGVATVDEVAAGAGNGARRAAADRAVGVVVVPAADLAALGARTRSLSPGRLPVALSVGAPEALRAAIATAEGIPAIRIDRVQVACPRTAAPAALLGLIDDALDGRRIPTYVELPSRRRADLLEELASSRFGALVRTGGPWTDSGRELPIAETLIWLVRACVPFVAESGDAVDVFSTSRRGVRSIGFLNLLLATDAAIDGAESDELVQVLSAGGDELVDAVACLDPRVRRRLGSITVPDVDRAARGLVSLGLLPREALVRTA